MASSSSAAADVSSMMTHFVKMSIQPSSNISKESVKALIHKRDAIEKEMDILTDTLQSSPAGLNGPLVDRSGFPRTDIDVQQIREMRHQLACLKTDFETLTKQIDVDLQALHEQTRKEAQASSSASSASSATTTSSQESTAAAAPSQQRTEFDDDEEMPTITEATSSQDTLIPFLMVNSVAENSPAEQAGLKERDLIVKFGTITKTQVLTYGLKVLSSFVEQNVQKEVTVIVERGKNQHTLKLVPRPWSGKGNLGCHLIPLN